MVDAVCDAVRDDLHLFHAHAAGRSGRGAQTNAGGDERAALLTRNGVLVGGDVNRIQTRLQILAGALLVGQINEQQVIVGTAGNQLDTARLQLCSHSLGILDDLACVLLELRLQCLAEANRLGRDNMLERTALGAREYSGVNALCQNCVVGQDQAAARTTKRLVGGGGNNVSIRHRVLVLTAGNQTGNVRHIDHQVSAVAMCDLGHFLEVDGTRIRGCTCNDQLRAMLLDSLLKLSVVDEAILVYAVGNKVVVLAGLVDRRAVAQVTALRQIHTHNGVAKIEQSEVNRKVGLCTGVRLNIRILCTEQLTGALDCDALYLVNKFTAAVVALAGKTLSVLIGQHAAHSSHNAGRNDIFAGDQLDILALTVQLLVHRTAQLGVDRLDHTDGIHHFFVHLNYLQALVV